MRIALISQQLNPGGREKALLSLADALQTRGWKVEVLTFLPGLLDQLFVQRGIPVRTFQARLKMQRISQLRRYLMQHRPNIVHTHLFSAGFWGRIAAKLAGVPVIIHTEGGMPFEEKRWKRIPAERLLTQFSDRVVCVAGAIKDHLVQVGGLPAESLVVIPNGIETDELLKIPLRPIADPPRIFSAGRLYNVKGYDVLIRAFAQVDRYNGKLVLAGDGPEAGALRQLADTLGVANRVEFLGYRDDIHGLLGQSDLYVTPSRSEGLSNSILEAMAAGVPVIATDVGGNRELLEGAGRIVPPENPKSMAASITEAVKESEITMTLAKKARQRIIDHYTLNKVVAAHEELYQQCLQAKGVNLEEALRPGP